MLELLERATRDSSLFAHYQNFLCASALYSIVATPLLIVFPQARYDGYRTIEALLDAAFSFGIVLRLRTTSPRDRCMYARSQLVVDLLAALPYQQMASAFAGAGPVQERLLWLHLLRALRGVYIIQRMNRLRGANVLRVIQMVLGFLLLGHYLGCCWYALVVWPLQDAPQVQLLHPWLWHDATTYDTAALYVCSLYWALSVMTNLKGPPAHESRMCLHEQPLVLVPLRERTYTIFVFVLGATFFSCAKRQHRRASAHAHDAHAHAPYAHTPHAHAHERASTCMCSRSHAARASCSFVAPRRSQRDLRQHRSVRVQFVPGRTAIQAPRRRD
jgi:hypothetical protein